VRDARYCGQYGEDRALLDGVDCVVVIGARAFLAFSREATMPLPPGATLVHAHAAPEHLGWTNTPAVGLAGDTREVLSDLRVALEARPLAADLRAARIAALHELRERAETANAADRARHDRLAAESGTISLVALTDALGATLPETALVFDEAISSSRALLRHTAFPDGARVFRTNGGALGWAVPAAVGAKIAAPERVVVAVVGDGSFHFSPQALWTAAEADAPIVVIVVDNGGYLAVKLAIERHLGVPRDDREHPGTMLGIDHASVARGYGADVVAIGAPNELEPALRTAFVSLRSTVMIVPVPNVRK
jgi:benzoylformate decarboxylase